MTPYDELIARATADPSVVGLILTGSRARGQQTSWSDTDVLVVGSWTETTRTPALDTIAVSIEQLADTSDRWQRYAYRGAQVLLDRLDGRIAELVRAQATLTPAETHEWTRAELDGYVNFVYRAAKSRRDGRDELAQLDEIEAASWFLWTLFSLYGRVRPYNKYLRWELETFPSPPPWTADLLIPALSSRPSLLFGELEVAARAKGYSDVLDGWGDELRLLRHGA